MLIDDIVKAMYLTWFIEYLINEVYDLMNVLYYLYTRFNV